MPWLLSLSDMACMLRITCVKKPRQSICPYLVQRLNKLTCVWYALNSGDAACFNATAKPAIVWLWGPPCSPGRR